ncbi:hypothetical protein [Paenibacillus camerounensis]|uniref:hypothetical protein n=1 Tax=Paenibacillus camerounensis TaxID=1243663 RepID=UPI000B1D528B|nr:hypothetical protein [Paenibacillus camerounensis]
MKKKIAGFLVLCILFFILMPGATKAAEQPVGLLDGVKMLTGTSVTNELGSTLKVTDNDVSTVFSLPYERSGNVEDTIFYNFPKAVTINAYKMHITNYDNGPVYLAYWNSSGTLVSRIPLQPNAGTDQIYFFPEAITGVTRISVYQTSTITYKLAEMNVYNILSEPTSAPTAEPTPEITATPEPTVEPTPTPLPSPTPEIPAGNRAILVVTMNTGLEKEFDLSMQEVNAFIAWYENKQAGSGTASYAIDKHDNNKGPFTSRKDYVIFDKILTFSVDEYSAE